MEAWWSLAMKNKHLDSQTPFWFFCPFTQCFACRQLKDDSCVCTLCSLHHYTHKRAFLVLIRGFWTASQQTHGIPLCEVDSRLFSCVRWKFSPFPLILVSWNDTIRIGIWLKFCLPNLLVIVWFYLNAETPHAKYLLHTSLWSNGWDFVVPTEHLLCCLNKLVFPWPQKSSIIRYFLLIINCWHDFGKMPTNFSLYVCANWDIGNHRLSNFGLKWRITSVQGFRAYNYLIWRCRLLICLPK